MLCAGAGSIAAPSSALLYFGHPQAVQVAPGIDFHGLFARELEGDNGSILRIEELALGALVGDQLHPLDEVLFRHGMIDGADVDGDAIAIHMDDGQVLFAAGFYGDRKSTRLNSSH